MSNNQKVTDKEPRLIDQKELCRRLDVTEVTLWKWRKDGRIPFLSLDRKVWYIWEDVIAAMRENANKEGDINE